MVLIFSCVILNCNSLGKVPIFYLLKEKQGLFMYNVRKLDLLALDMIIFVIQEVTIRNVSLEYYV